jgi:4-amino-4-deoxy-L-arabinose transferase-like glycosyltransferase
MITFAVYGTLLAMYSFGGRMQMGGANLGEQVIVGLTTVFFYLMIAAMIGWLGARPGAGQARRARRASATPPATIAMTEAAPETAPEAASEQMSQQ